MLTKEKLYTVKQVADMLGVSHDMVTRWVKSGKVPARRANPLAGPGSTSPFLIDASEVERIKKAMKANVVSKED